MIVVDNNVVVYLFVDGPYRDEVRALFLHDPVWLVPPLWQSEFCNVMLGYIRRDDIALDTAIVYFQEAKQVIRIDQSPPAQSVLSLSIQHNISAYDATYAALAQQKNVQHVTYDKKLIECGLGIPPRELLEV